MLAFSCIYLKIFIKEIRCIETTPSAAPPKKRGRERCQTLGPEGFQHFRMENPAKETKMGESGEL